MALASHPQLHPALSYRSRRMVCQCDTAGLGRDCSHQHLCQRAGGNFGYYTGGGALFGESDRAHARAHILRSSPQYSTVSGDFYFLFLPFCISSYSHMHQLHFHGNINVAPRHETACISLPNDLPTVKPMSFLLPMLTLQSME